MQGQWVAGRVLSGLVVAWLVAAVSSARVAAEPTKKSPEPRGKSVTTLGDPTGWAANPRVALENASKDSRSGGRARGPEARRNVGRRPFTNRPARGLTPGEGGGAGFPEFCAECGVGRLACGESVSGTTGAGSCDFEGFASHVWELELEVDTSVDIAVSQSGSAEPPFLSLYDASCSFFSAGGVSGRLVRNLAAGTYFIGVDTLGDSVEPYTLEASCSEVVACSDCPVEPLACESGSVRGGFTDADCLLPGGKFFDVYQFELPEAGRVTINMRSAVVDSYVFLLNENCLQVSEADGCVDSLDACVTADLAPGSYFVVASTYESREVGAYVLDFDCRPGFDPCVDCVVDTVACDATIKGALTSSDCPLPDGRFYDLYRFDLTEGGRLTVDMRSTAVDAFLILFDENCEPFAEGDDCRETDACVVADLEPGAYFIGATTFDVGEVGSYELQTRCTVGFDPCQDCVVTPLSCGKTLASSFPRSGCRDEYLLEQDFYPFRVDEVGPVVFTVTSLSEPFLTIADASCQLLDVGGVAFRDLPDGSVVQEFSVPSLEPGGYNLHVADGLPGALTIAMRCPDIGFCRDCTVGDIDCSADMEGSLNAESCALPGGERVALWRLELLEFTNVSVTATSEAFQPSVSLLDSFCEPLFTWGNCSLQPCRQTGLFPGIYYIEVAADAPGADGAYQLSMRCEPFNPCRDCAIGEIECGQQVMAGFRETSCPGPDPSEDAGFWTFHVDEFQRVDFRVESMFRPSWKWSDPPVR